MSGLNVIGMVKSVGLIHTHAKMKKKRTYVVKRVYLVKYYIEEEDFETATITFNLPKLSSMPGQVQGIWKSKYEEWLPWKTKGDNQEIALREIQNFMEDVSVVFTKNYTFDSRLLNNYGLYPEYLIDKLDVTTDTLAVNCRDANTVLSVSKGKNFKRFNKSKEIEGKKKGYGSWDKFDYSKPFKAIQNDILALIEKGALKEFEKEDEKKDSDEKDEEE